jgi:hypothetical protein
MKTRVLVFLFTALLALAIVPAINLHAFVTKPHGPKAVWWHRSVLYNLDFIQPPIARALYPLGISTKPESVIIGKDDWLFLGDRFGDTISIDRKGAAAADLKKAGDIRFALTRWDAWLKAHGVKRFIVIMGANKNSIYPEYLPRWAKPAPDSATDVLLATVGPEFYLDTRPALRAAKSRFPLPLYHKTDTHWNEVGAWVAYRALAAEIGRTEPDLRWLSFRDARISGTLPRGGGDLTDQGWLKGALQDTTVTFDIDRSISIEQYDYASGNLVASGGNPLLTAPLTPTLVKSKNALNHARVLWLRDSFGEGLAPFMAATFSDVLQLHHRVTTREVYGQLVESFKPDYVFITVVERDATEGRFTSPPPPSP